MFDPELLRRYFEQAGAQGGVPQQDQQMIQPAPPQRMPAQGAQLGTAQITPANITPLGGQAAAGGNDKPKLNMFQDLIYRNHPELFNYDNNGLSFSAAGQERAQQYGYKPPQGATQMPQTAPITPPQGIQPRSVGNFAVQPPDNLPSFGQANQKAQLIRR